MVYSVVKVAAVNSNLAIILLTLAPHACKCTLHAYQWQVRLNGPQWLKVDGKDMRGNKSYRNHRGSRVQAIESGGMITHFKIIAKVPTDVEGREESFEFQLWGPHTSSSTNKPPRGARQPPIEDGGQASELERAFAIKGGGGSIADSTGVALRVGKGTCRGGGTTTSRPNAATSPMEKSPDRPFDPRGEWLNSVFKAPARAQFWYKQLSSEIVNLGTEAAFLNYYKTIKSTEENFRLALKAKLQAADPFALFRVFAIDKLEAHCRKKVGEAEEYTGFESDGSGTFGFGGGA